MTGGGRRKAVLFGKQGCHLCEAVEGEMRSIGAALEVVDIDGDDALHDRYWMRVPVVAIDGEEVFEAKMMDKAGRWKGKLVALLGSATDSRLARGNSA